jgi:hypothetical protein
MTNANANSHYHNKKAAQQLFVAYYQFELAGLVVSHVLGISRAGRPAAPRSIQRSP